MDTINNNNSIKLNLELKFDVNKYITHIIASNRNSGVSIYSNNIDEAAEEISKFIKVYLKKLK